MFRVFVCVCDLMCDTVWFGLLWLCVVVYALCCLFDVFVPLVVTYCVVLYVCFLWVAVFARVFCVFVCVVLSFV